MAKRPGPKASRLSAEERLLEQQREEVLRRQQMLEKRLKVLPAVMEAQEEQKRELSRRRAAEGGRAISPSMGRGTRRLRAKTLRTPSSERWYAKAQTLLLIAILIIIGLLLWHTVPMGK